MNKLTTLIMLIGLGSASMASAKPADRIIEKMDTDDDGMISQYEFQPGSHGPFKWIDEDEDGIVTSDEFEQHLASREAEANERQAAMKSRAENFFNEADANQDGSITSEEAKNAAFSRMDEDGDGFLTASELRKGGPRHHKRGRGFGHGKPMMDSDS